MAAVRAALGVSASSRSTALLLSHLRRPYAPSLSFSRRNLRVRCIAMATAAAKPLGSDRKKVLVPIAFGTEEIEAVILIDVLRRAGADVLVASVEQDLRIEASRRLFLLADESIFSCEGKTFDLVALPGGMPGAARLRDCEVLKKIVTKNAKEGRLFGAICAAPAVALEPWGLLEGRKAVCHPAFVDKLPSSSTVNSRVQRDGLLTTSRGPGTAMEFALSFVDQLYGKEKFDEVSRPLILRSDNGHPHLKQYNCQDWLITKTPEVLVPIANGSEEMEATIIIDVLRRAGARVVVASVEESLQIVASRCVNIVADRLISDVKGSTFDLIVLPGGMPGAERLYNCEDLSKMLKEHVDANRFLGAICAAPAVVLEANGLLMGKKATCHPTFAMKLLEQSAVDSRVVVDGLVITSQGPGTAMEFSLSIVEKIFGRERATSIAGAMVFEYP